MRASALLLLGLSLGTVVACEGPEGLAGAPGNNGVDGTDGMDGSDGVDGNDGMDGQPGVIGEACWDESGNGLCDAATEDINSDGFCDYLDCQGEDGPAGLQGDPGPQGDQGPQGAQGPPGITGPQGPIGLTGPMGPVGPEGPTGPAGPIGLTGATGPAGPPGSGIVSTDLNGATGYLTTTCSNYAGSAVTVTAPGPGVVVVQANTRVQIDHTAGTTDNMILGIGSSASDCGSSTNQVYWETPASLPSASSVDQTFMVIRTFNVNSAGTFTYYLNGYISSGYAVNTDRFWYASMIATFHQN